MEGPVPLALPLWADPDAPLPLSTIVIVTYNKIELTLRCLERLYALTDAPFEVVIVDNASSDGTVSQVRARAYPRLSVIANEQNLGFGPGCNIGAKAARGDVLVFLNNDTLVSRGWLRGLIDKLVGHPRVGVVGPMTNVASNAQLLPPGYPTDPERTDEVAAALARDEAGRVVLMRRMIGFCFALPRRVWEEIGPFDEGFGVGHYEDDDLCVRLERHGYFAAAARDVYVHHYASQSFQAAGIDTMSSVRAKAFLFYEKWGSAYLDWPDLKGNLSDALHVVARVHGAADLLPRWKRGMPPFLVTGVCPGASSATTAALEQLFADSAVFACRTSRALAPLGEAFNVGIACHYDAREQLLVPALPAPTNFDQFLRGIETARADGVDAVAFYRDAGAEPEGYYLTREALLRAGPLDPAKRELDALIDEHLGRVRLSGLTTAEARWSRDAQRWLTTPSPPPPAEPLPLPRQIRKAASAVRTRLSRSESAWIAPTPIRRRFPDKTVNITMLSFNRLDFTRQAVTAVRDKTRHPHRLVVVDNGSAGETVAWLKDAKRRGLIDVLIVNDRNLGVAAAANQGWIAFETDYYVKLDNDIVIENPDWLGTLVAAADRVPDAGMVGCNFEPISYPLEEIAGMRLRPRPLHLGGACVLITPEAHRVAGYWCEDYFPYSEEDFDMGYRLHLAGFRHYYIEDENAGAHLPRGRATRLDGARSFDDEDDAKYRSFKDEARRRHIGAFSMVSVNQRLYRRGDKSLYSVPGSPGETPRGKLEKRVYGWVRDAMSALGRGGQPAP